MTTVDHIEVFYIDPMTGWATAEYDAQNIQIGEAAYSYLKTDAVKEARAMAGSIYPIRVFNKAGEHHQTINKAAQ